MNVFPHQCGQGRIALAIQKLKAVNDEIGLIAEGNRGSPSLPAIGTLSLIQAGTQKTDYNG